MLNDTQAIRITELTTRIGELEVLNTTNAERIEFLGERNILLAEQRVRFEADLAEAQDNCDAASADGLYYLHADHLGRPQFATDITGAVVWDMGEGVTPFGDSVNLAGAFAQRLMFPGQYADVETSTDGDTVTLSHNWHRTYDPTLGRYLQSDPIGLAGGLNRFAYVGGNPVSYVDPMGLDIAFLEDQKGETNSEGDESQYGHIYLVFQDGIGQCYRFDTQGDLNSSKFGPIGAGFNGKLIQGARIKPVDCKKLNEGARFRTTWIQDLHISSCAREAVDRANNGTEQYKLFSNNCADSAVGVAKCGGVKLRNPILPFPNTIQNSLRNQSKKKFEKMELRPSR